MESKEDFTCAICLNLLCEPVKTKCGHHFCFLCIDQLLDNVVDKFSCPLCRTKLSGTKIDKDVQLKNQIQNECPDEFKQRMVLYQKEIEFQERMLKFRVLYGNDHKFEDNGTSNSHRWRMFVRLPEKYDNIITKYIESVTFELHPTFHPPVVTLRKPPYELERLGWGIFQINIRIKWQPCINRKETLLEHMLSFSGNGISNTYVIRVEKTDQLAQLQQSQDKKDDNDYNNQKGLTS